MIALIVIVALTGGSNRQDVGGLLVLRPTAVLMLAVGLWFLSKEAVRAARPIFALLAVIFVTALAQILPLPPSLWESLPGRAELVPAAAMVGLDSAWRPMSIVPSRTVAFLFGLFVPTAALVLALSCSAKQKRQLAVAILVFAVASVLLGAAQIAAEAGAGLYFYKFMDRGLPVGFFANRNHQAIMLVCMIPIAAALVAPRPGRRVSRPSMIALLGAIALVTGVLLVIGSRGGILLACVAVATLPVVVNAGRDFWRWMLIIMALLIGVVAIYLGLGRAEAINRLFGSGGSGEVRLMVVRPIMGMMWQYFPFGAGSGTFVEAYQRIEPDSVLHDQYLNHAHIDPVEAVIESGVVAIVLMAAAFFFWGRQLMSALSSTRATSPAAPLQRAGLAVILILALASVADYPLRVPIIQVIAMVAAVWSLGMEDSRPVAAARSSR